MNKQAEKEKIRRDLLDRRSKIPERDYLSKSEKIISNLQQIPVLRSVQTIHCYVSVNERREVNTHPLLKELLSSGYNVVVPVTQIEHRTLKHIQLNSFNDLQPNNWGVPEPCQGEKVFENILDLVIVPMVGGDINRNRIGYGKGYYDRFLQKVTCPAIGLLFETCLVDKIPVESFDVRLDKLVTEDRVIEKDQKNNTGC